VVNKATPFKFADGSGFSLGEMGEAGPEAVMPLKRGSDGSLGVQMFGGQQRSQSSNDNQSRSKPSVSIGDMHFHGVKDRESFTKSRDAHERDMAIIAERALRDR